MNGWIMMHGNCAACGTRVAFNPNKVPSIRVHGVREPLCAACVVKANTKAKAEGKPEFQIPEGAYEPTRESEIDWN